MKFLFLSAFIVLLPINLFADCAGSGLYFWPNGKNLSSSSIIMIEGYAASQNLIDTLCELYPVYLVHEDEKIALKIKEIRKGQFYLTQVLLIPEKRLSAGKTYSLVIEGLEEDYTAATRWNSNTQKHESVEWTVMDEGDAVPPAWEIKPTLIGTDVVHYGCGPAEFASFKLSVKDDSPVLVRVSVTGKSSGINTIYYLDITGKNELEIGHGMCSGAFTFETDKEFDVRFDLLDAAGNVTTWQDDEMTFPKPKGDF